MRLATERRVDARVWDARARLARILYELASDYGEPTPEGVMIALPLTQSDLGALAMVAESTTERLLKDFRKRGLLLTRYRRTVVLDMAALEAERHSVQGPRKP